MNAALRRGIGSAGVAGLTSLLLGLLIAGPAHGHGAQERSAADGPGVLSPDDGLEAIELEDGTSLMTHGPDLRPRLGVLDGSARATPAAAPEGLNPVCAGASSQHILYGHPHGTADRRVAAAPGIYENVRTMTGFLDSETRASGGGGARFRVLCDGQGQVRIDGFEGLDTDECPADNIEFNCIVEAARAAGFDDDRRNYTIFYDHGGSWSGGGQGSIWPDSRPSTDNLNHPAARQSREWLRSAYAITWGDSEGGDPPTWLWDTQMHEVGHNMGAVLYWAPFSTGTGHCWLDLDIMCYDDGGEKVPATGTDLRCAVVRFDCRFNTYFNAAPAPNSYLATHWNLGSCRNALIEFEGPCNAPNFVRLVNKRPRPAATGPFTDDWSYYRIQVPPRRRVLRAVLTLPAGVVGDLDLYVRRGKRPNENQFNCRRAPRAVRQIQRCPIKNPRRGQWWIGVRTQWLGTEDGSEVVDRHTRHRILATHLRRR